MKERLDVTLSLSFRLKQIRPITPTKIIYNSEEKLNAFWPGIEKGSQRLQWINLKGEWDLFAEIGNCSLRCLAMGQIVQWNLELLTSPIQSCNKDILDKDGWPKRQCHNAANLLTNATLQKDLKSPEKLGSKKYSLQDSLAKPIAVQVCRS